MGYFRTPLLAGVVKTVRTAVPAPEPIIVTGLVEPKLNVGRYCAPTGEELSTAEREILPAKPPVGATVIVEVFPDVAPRTTVTAVPLIVTQFVILTDTVPLPAA
jgi:hypothetical protein